MGSFTATASSKSALPSAMLPLYVSTLCCSEAMAANAYDRQCLDIPVPFVSAAAGCAVRGCTYSFTGCATTAANELPSVAFSAHCQYDSTPTPMGFAPAGTPPRASPSQAQTGFFTFISSTCASLWTCRHPWKPWPQPPMSSSLMPLANTCQPYGMCTSSPFGPNSYIIPGSSFVPAFSSPPQGCLAVGGGMATSSPGTGQSGVLWRLRGLLILGLICAAQSISAGIKAMPMQVNDTHGNQLLRLW